MAGATPASDGKKSIDADNGEGDEPSPDKSAALLVLTALVGLLAAIGGISGALDKMFSVAPVLATVGIGLLFAGGGIAIAAGLLPSLLLHRRDFKATAGWRRLQALKVAGHTDLAAVEERAKARFDIKRSRDRERVELIGHRLRLASAVALLLGAILIVAALAQRIQSIAEVTHTTRPAISGGLELTDGGLILHTKVVASGMDASKSLVVRAFWLADPNPSSSTTGPTGSGSEPADTSSKFVVFEQVAGPVDGTATVEVDVELKAAAPQSIAVLARVGSTAKTSELNGLTTSGGCQFEQDSSTTTTAAPGATTTEPPDDARSGCLVFRAPLVAMSTSSPPSTSDPPTATTTATATTTTTMTTTTGTTTTTTTLAATTTSTKRGGTTSTGKTGSTDVVTTTECTTTTAVNSTLPCAS